MSESRASNSSSSQPIRPGGPLAVPAAGSARRRTALAAALLAAAAASGAFYLLRARDLSSLGLPLDDAWIHQTYARNLAEHGEWSFRAGAPSAGSTSPLWSVLLALGFLLGLTPYIWAYFLGMLVMYGIAITTEVVARHLISSYSPRIPWVGLFFIVEWHLLWAALSGMETLLHGLIVTVGLSALMMNSHRYLTLGLLTGISVWVRPDGLTLLGPLVLAVILFEKDTPSRFEAYGEQILKLFGGKNAN